MAGTGTVSEIELIIEDIGGGGGVGRPPGGGDDDGSDGGSNDKRSNPRPPSPRRYYTGIIVGIVSILMFFMALASAFLVRRGTSNDWIPVHLPWILWLNTAVLLVSSGTLEFARRKLSHSDTAGFRKLWMLTTALGVLFLVRQLIAWRQLAAQGVFIASNP